MKKICFYIFICASAIGLGSCEKEGFQLYESGNYVQFVKHVNDSTLGSFLALPNADEMPFPLVVELVGNLATTDRHFNISLMDSQTTAPAANYSIPESFVFRANRTTDTAWITLKKTEDIAITPVRLVVRLQESEDLMVGQIDYSAAIIQISNVISQPQWWNTTVSGTFLGNYSDKKYRLFIDVTGRADIDAANLAEVRLYTIMFKNYLLREKDEGRTVYEENGAEMTVNLIGG